MNRSDQREVTKKNVKMTRPYSGSSDAGARRVRVPSNRPDRALLRHTAEHHRSGSAVRSARVRSELFAAYPSFDSSATSAPPAHARCPELLRLGWLQPGGWSNFCELTLAQAFRSEAKSQRDGLDSTREKCPPVRRPRGCLGTRAYGTCSAEHRAVHVVRLVNLEL